MRQYLFLFVCLFPLTLCGVYFVTTITLNTGGSEAHCSSCELPGRATREGSERTRDQGINVYRCRLYELSYNSLHNGLLSPSGIPELRVEKPVSMEMGYKCTCMYVYQQVKFITGYYLKVIIIKIICSVIFSLSLCM